MFNGRAMTSIIPESVKRSSRLSQRRKVGIDTPWPGVAFSGLGFLEVSESGTRGHELHREATKMAVTMRVIFSAQERPYRGDEAAGPLGRSRFSGKGATSEMH